MINCKKCGRPNEDHYRFCLGCGARLDQQKPAEKKDDLDEEEKTRSISLASISRPPSDEAPEPVDEGEETSEASGEQSPGDATEASTPVICWSCNSAIKLGNAFCGKCGRSAEPPPGHGPKAELVLIQADGTEGHRIHLNQGEQVLGRDDKLLKDDPFISPRHARFVLDDKSLLSVQDLDSLNGLFIRLKAPRNLEHGDQLRVGLELLEFQLPNRLPALTNSEPGTRLMGSPEPRFWGRLARIASPDACSHAFLLTRDEVIIGRDRGDIVFRNDAFVSGTHARISLEGQGPTLEDLNSSNGTYIRLNKSLQSLDHGDMLLIGQQIVMVSLPS